MGKFVTKIVYVPDEYDDEFSIIQAEMAYMLNYMSEQYEIIFSGLDELLQKIRETNEKRNENG